jgi:hypothetical protein
MFRKAIFICLALVVAVVAKDATAVGNDVTVQFLGQSGKMKLYRTNTAGNTNIEVSFDKLTELDDKDKAIGGGINLASQVFEWSTPVEVKFQGFNTTKVTLISTLSNGARFNVTVYLYRQTGSIVHGNTTYTVLTDHVKFTVNIKSWPFGTTNNKLKFGIDCKFKGGKKSFFPDHGEPKNKNEQSVYFGAGQIDVSNKVIIDGVTRQIVPVIVNQGAFTGVELTFPHFNDQVDYDPTMAIGNFSFLSAPNPLLAALLALGSILLAWN